VTRRALDEFLQAGIARHGRDGIRSARGRSYFFFPRC
jgi:hypothetical protein